MLQVRQMPGHLTSIPEIQAHVQDAVLVNNNGTMVIHPRQVALLIRGGSEIELHTTFGTVHYLHYDIPAQLGEDWRNLVNFMNVNQTGTGCSVWHKQDVQGNEYYLHLHIPSVLRISKSITDSNLLLPTTVVIETGDCQLQMEFDEVICAQLVDEISSAIRTCWAI